MSPGRSVAFDKSMTVAPEGIFALAESVTLSIRSPRTIITCWLRGAFDLPSIRIPARITVTDCELVGPDSWAKAPTQTARINIQPKFFTLLSLRKLRKPIFQLCAEMVADDLAGRILYPGTNGGRVGWNY